MRRICLCLAIIGGLQSATLRFVNAETVFSDNFDNVDGAATPLPTAAVGQWDAANKARVERRSDDAVPGAGNMLLGWAGGGWYPAQANATRTSQAGESVHIEFEWVLWTNSFNPNLFSQTSIHQSNVGTYDALQNFSGSLITLRGFTDRTIKVVNQSGGLVDTGLVVPLGTDTLGTNQRSPANFKFDYVSGASTYDLTMNDQTVTLSTFTSGAPGAVSGWGANISSPVSMGGPGGYVGAWDNLLINMGSSAGVQGDYNGNGIVDAADYVLWRKGASLQNEIVTPGAATPEDYTEWRARFGNSGSGTGAVASTIPEPGARALVTIVLIVFLGACRFRFGNYPLPIGAAQS